MLKFAPFPAVLMLIVVLDTSKDAIMQSDLQNKGERKMLKEHPPQKKEDGAAAGLLGWMSPYKAHEPQQWGKQLIPLAQILTISVPNCRIALQSKRIIDQSKAIDKQHFDDSLSDFKYSHDVRRHH